MTKPYDLLNGVLNTIENGLRLNINPDSLAAYCNLSTRHLERIFKYAFDKNIGSYIRSRKLAESLNDLLKTNEKVLYIALEYNFDFEQSYIRSFKREFGITPGDFRKSGRLVRITSPLQIISAKKLLDDILYEQESDLIPKLCVVGGNSYGNITLPDSPYGYDVWSERSFDNKLLWYGAEEKGGAAFRAEWNNSKEIIERIGYFWNEGKPYTEYKNIFCDFSLDKSFNCSVKTGYTDIGVCGWFKNPLIDWYIIDDWSGNNKDFPIGCFAGIEKVKIGEAKIDGSIYTLYKSIRKNKPSIEGIATYNTYFSVRQNRRQKGTISITEHFREWEKHGLILGNNMYEAKFYVYAVNGTGSFDAEYVSLYQE